MTQFRLSSPSHIAIQFWHCAAFVFSMLPVLFPLAVTAEPMEGRSLSFLPRKEIDPSMMGINAFVNNQSFGTIAQQFTEVQETLGLKHVRVLFAWNDDVQPTPDTAPDFSFYDNIIKDLPKGMRALVILTGIPSWMYSADQWIANDPRRTFVRRWVRLVAARYRRKRKVVGFQVWNEPNMDSNEDNVLLEMNDSPGNYLALLKRAKRVIDRRTRRRKKIVSAATTSIIQNYPDSLQYNEELFALGAESHLDIWGVHLYGSSWERFSLVGDVSSYLNGLSKPVWVTESGEKGINEQRNYVERMWPYAADQAPGITRFYFYQFTEDTPAESTYGLRNLTPGLTISDLYIWLRDRDTTPE